MSESDAKEELLKVVSELQEEVEQLREENRKLRGEDDKPPAPPNDEIVERHFEDKNYADSTERPKRHAIKYFRRHLDDKPFREVTTNDALDFANNWSGESGQPKRSSILNYLQAVKVLYDWMMRQEWGPDENVVERAREEFKSENKGQIRRSGQHTGTVIEPEEYLELIRANMSPRLQAILVLPVKTGLRRKELAALKVQDVDLEAKKVYNCSPKGVGDDRLSKADADQKLIDDETVEVLESWLHRREIRLQSLEDRDHSGYRDEGGGPDSDWLFPNDAGEKLTPMTVSRWWDKATTKAEHRIKDDQPELAQKFGSMTPHDARRCFTSWLNWNNCPRDIIKALRGDADGDMVSLYTQYGEDKVRREYENAMPTLGLN